MVNPTDTKLINYAIKIKKLTTKAGNSQNEVLFIISLLNMVKKSQELCEKYKGMPQITITPVALKDYHFYMTKLVEMNQAKPLNYFVPVKSLAKAITSDLTYRKDIRGNDISNLNPVNYFPIAQSIVKKVSESLHIYWGIDLSDMVKSLKTIDEATVKAYIHELYTRKTS